MGEVKESFSSTYRDFSEDGVKSSGIHNPTKSDQRELGQIIERAIANIGLGALVDVAHATRAELDLDLAYEADAVGLVYNDPVQSNTDLYLKVGASGTGSWTLTSALHDLIQGLAQPYLAALEDALGDADLVAITRMITNALIDGGNLFNPADPDCLDDRFVDDNNGTIKTNTAYAVSGFMPVEAGGSYYLSHKSLIAWFDEAKTYISGTSGTEDSDNAQTAPAGAAFLRASYVGSKAEMQSEFYLIEGSVPANEVPPYGGLISPDRVRGLPTDSLADGAVTPEKTSFLTRTRQLFDKSTITPGSFAGSNGIVKDESLVYHLSDFIRVESGETYVGWGTDYGMRFWTAYDENKNVVQAAGSDVSGSIINVPESGVRFYRVTLRQSDLDDFQFEKGAAPTAKVPYGSELAGDVYLPNTTGMSGWNGKSLVTYGDSVTAQLTWQGAIRGAFGFTHTALGVGGRQIGGSSGMCQDSEINTIPQTTQCLLSMGGINDWAQSRPLGALDSTDTDEFYGALNQMAEKQSVRLPLARIFWLTPTYAEFTTANGIARGWNDGITNNAGLSVHDYAEAVRVVARKWGFPIIDLTAEAGINTINIDPFMKEDGNYIHPDSTDDDAGDIFNDAGGTRIAEVVIGRLRQFDPLS